MGAKLFAWIGGLALFLGIGFFVKYSFEHNLIPPEVRVAIGFARGPALLLGGVLLKRKENAVTAQTLCATGVLVLYAVTFACRAYYHFPLLWAGADFSFDGAGHGGGLPARDPDECDGHRDPGHRRRISHARCCSPPGQDYPLPLFGYIALLDIGLLAVAQRQRWGALPILGAIGTVLFRGGLGGCVLRAGASTSPGPKLWWRWRYSPACRRCFWPRWPGANVRGVPAARFPASALSVGAAALIFACFLLSFQTLGASARAVVQLPAS